MKSLTKIILRLFGWKVVSIVPPEKQYIVVVAPHTSLMDFVWGAIGFWSLGIKPQFMIKKEFFVFPIKRLLKKVGGIAVDRQSPQGIVQYCVSQFQNGNLNVLTLTPEGTRKKTTKWKRGFHSIAQAANVPVYIGQIDYKTKTLGVLFKFYITDEPDKDMQRLKSIYVNVRAKHPDKFTV